MFYAAFGDRLALAEVCALQSVILVIIVHLFSDENIIYRIKTSIHFRCQPLDFKGRDPREGAKVSISPIYIYIYIQGAAK